MSFGTPPGWVARERVSGAMTTRCCNGTGPIWVGEKSLDTG